MFYLDREASAKYISEELSVKRSLEQIVYPIKYQQKLYSCIDFPHLYSQLEKHKEILERNKKILWSNATTRVKIRWLKYEIACCSVSSFFFFSYLVLLIKEKDQGLDTKPVATTGDSFISGVEIHPTNSALSRRQTKAQRDLGCFVVCCLFVLLFCFHLFFLVNSIDSKFLENLSIY